MSIRIKIIGLLAVVLALSLIANACFINSSQNKQAETQMLENARIMAAEMQASWDFIEMNQERIDTDKDGSYNFKGIYCAVAGRGISLLFMDRTDYILRYVSSDPRNPIALADDFEGEALAAFRSGALDYYKTTSYENEPSFRYAAPIFFEESCLSCHGLPVGEIDVTGREKEGMKVGDLAGAISIVIPSELYLTGISNNIREQTIFFAIVISIIALLIFFAMEKLISRPLREMSTAIAKIKRGDFDFSLKKVDGKDEIGAIASEFTDMAKELQLVQNTLENRVAQRTQELEQLNGVLETQRENLKNMNTLLQQEVEYKSDFLAIMGHELKTPLTSILAYIELWEKELEIDSASFDRDAFAEVKTNGQILMQMIDNILDTARIEAGRMELRKQYVDVGDIARSVAGRLSFLAIKKDISIDITISPDVSLIRADEDKIRRIIENLLSNAIKYTGNGGRVSIKAEIDENKTAVVISISDNGMGIAQENLPDVFLRFTRFCSDKSVAGSGLGLSVAKELAEMHDGNITISSELGKGSIFFIAIPTSMHQKDILEDE